MPSVSPILVIDSGLGGLTVARALRMALPNEDLIYFGDTARLPYGNKTARTVCTFVCQIIRHLLAYEPKHVVIACNTATALALPEVRKAFPGLPVSGVVEPGARAAAAAAGPTPEPVIGVIATEATIRSGAYLRAIHRRRHRARIILRPTPLLVPIIEEGRSGDDPLVKVALAQYLAPLVERKMRVLVLGCTHYPILRDAIERQVGPDVAVIDSANQCAQDVATRLGSTDLLRPESAGKTGRLRCFVTDDASRFARLGSRFLGVELDRPTLISPDSLYTAAAAVTLRKAG